ncbi:hypothetical protein DICSQDRAFT_157294 [Dichomitus squalens LYAD-421 SS1]|uniref:Uncharacterized protein n=1 Tax=Dichomitus squalens (strain LYAD-421) TaxID=732165 RepID=R7SN36_DICSQ|nr:uncharacterized protein DICSQDRAFT_157294 [Dichomitus squalens LYAD-421 SS1]EJF57599.1 hypothetical protein DICSQDRAFT_157294 [Dichomitus squalens LYAD-421 SS1]
MTTDLITYRLGAKNYCYIPPPKTYEEALSAAKTNYKELKHVDEDCITFCVIATVAGVKQHIRVSPASWPIVVSKLHRYEVLDIVLQFDDDDTIPDIIVHSAKDVESLPTYEDIREKTGMDDFLAPSCHSSPQVKSIPLETIRAVQRYPRRTPSPARSSHSKSSSPSSSLTDLAKSLFGRSPSPQ